MDHSLTKSAPSATPATPMNARKRRRMLASPSTESLSTVWVAAMVELVFVESSLKTLPGFLPERMTTTMRTIAAMNSKTINDARTASVTGESPP